MLYVHSSSIFCSKHFLLLNILQLELNSKLSQKCHNFICCPKHCRRLIVFATISSVLWYFKCFRIYHLTHFVFVFKLSDCSELRISLHLQTAQCYKCSLDYPINTSESSISQVAINSKVDQKWNYLELSEGLILTTSQLQI